MSAIPGFHGVLLDVNLSAGTVARRSVPKDWSLDWLGGRGLGVRLLWRLLPGPGVDPLGPDNPLMFMPGPLSGFPVPSASRTCIVTKSPVTAPASSDLPHASGISYSNIGGFLGPEIRFAGYDGLVIRGASPEPVVLVIDDDEVELRPAGELWGMGTEGLDEALAAFLGRRDYRSAYIGPAGEALSLRACILHTAARAAGRGVGAVMGSKKLKAVAVRGSQMPTVKDHEAFLAGLERARRRYQGMLGTLYSGVFRRSGTSLFIELSSKQGHEAVRNYREGTFGQAAAIGAKAAREQVWVRNSACYCCRLSCKKSGAVRSGEHAHVVHDGPEYETGVMFGSNLMIDDMPGMLKAIAIGDDLGLDIISTGNVIGFLMEAYEKGDVDRAFLDGIDLQWGSVPAVHAMIEKIAAREGVGALASQGVAAMSRAIGEHTAPYAIHVKGMELAAHNIHDNAPRALGYATSNRGACHLSGDSKGGQDFVAAVDSLGVCLFAVSPGGPLPGLRAGDAALLLEAITGEPWDEERFARVGERIFTAERLFNHREGFGVADDTVPERFFTEPLTIGRKQGAVLDREAFERDKQAWYAARGIDPGTGRPTDATLERLGLRDLG
jgi:aldehyde:ferredoxin oxidoreductase